MSIASPEIRRIAVEAYLSAKATQQQLADILGFHRTAIVRWVREYREEGKLEPRVRGHMAKAFSNEEKERLDGSTECVVVDGAMDKAMFVEYIVQMLCPSLRPNDIVIMDNLSAHKNPDVAEHIKRCGVELLYLPP